MAHFMQLFNGIFTDPAEYPEDRQEILEKTIKVWNDELEVLQASNIPMPELIKAAQSSYENKYEQKSCKHFRCKEHGGHYRQTLTVYFPQHEAPPHFLFRITNHRSKDPRSNQPQVIYAVLWGEAAAIARARQLHESHNFIELIREFKFRFFTADPYEFFRHKETKGSCQKRSDNFSKPEWKHLTDTIPNVPIPSGIKEITFFAQEELALIDERLVLCVRYFSGVCDTPRLNEFFLNERWKDKQEVHLPVDFIYNAVLPSKTFATDTVTLKLLPNADLRAGTVEQFFDQLRSQIQMPLAFELVSDGKTIFYQLTVAKIDQEKTERQLKLFFPNFGIQEIQSEWLTATSLYAQWCVPEWGYELLRGSNTFTVDPYNQLFGILSELPTDQRVILQLLLTPFPDKTQERLQQIAQWLASSKSPACTERNRQISKKHSLWAIQLGIFSTGKEIIERIKRGFLNQYETPEQTWAASSIYENKEFSREFQSYNAITSAELESLGHFPDKTVQCDLLETASMKSKLPPDLYTEQGAVIGASSARGMTKTVTLPDSIRDRHTYILGRSGSGKSTLLTNLIVQDIQAGKGVCVLDPHGELTESIVDYIPEERIKDTIYLNVTDEDHPIPLNILNTGDAGNIALLVDDLVATFKRLVDSSTWTSRMDAILRGAVQLLLRQPRAHAFLDIRKVLRNKDYRDQLLKNVTYEPVREFWEEDFPGYPKDAIQPIVNRMARFADFPTLYTMLSTPKSQINFDEIMQQRKILLVNPAAGIIGDDNSKLIGCLIVSQLQLAAMRRAKMLPEKRVPFSLYVDEFQNFISSPFDRILSEARKYRLCLTFAHQFISQLDDITRDAILGNVGTIVVMPINEKDAGMLRRSVGDYEITDILNLDASKHEALCRPATKASDTFSFVTNPPPQRLAESNRQAIIEHTRAIYGARIEPETPTAPDPAVAVPEPLNATQSPADTLPTFCTDCGSLAVPGAKFCPNCGKLSSIPSQSLEPRPEQATVTPAPPLEKIILERPAPAIPKNFASNRDKVLHYLSQAQYLTTPQIISLCYTQKSNASADLSKLVSEKKIKEITNSRPKIYYSGQTPNVTDHNLAIRDLFVKIARSNFEIAGVDFTLQLSTLNPDLCVDFVLPSGKIQKTFWEYDTGTEGTKELKRKVERYASLSPTEANRRAAGLLVSPHSILPGTSVFPVIFVFKDRSILNRVMPVIDTSFTFGVVLSEFETVDKAEPLNSLFAR
jgi:hypothetical protein